MVVSDESGCCGPSYLSRSSQNYVISTICFKDEDALKAFVDIAKRISRKYLGSPLRKWTGLKGQTKNDPTALAGFLNELFSTLGNDYFFVISLTLLNKAEIETGIKDKSVDKQYLKSEANRAYELSFKRIFPFIKRYHYVSRKYYLGNNPTIKWLIDINDVNFQKRHKSAISALAKSGNVILDGPHFIEKTDANNHYFVTAIKIIDIIGGVTTKAFDFYTDKTFKCIEKDCLNTENCANPFIEPWKVILQHSANINILANGRQFWSWQGLIYRPGHTRTSHSRFLTQDKYYW